MLQLMRVKDDARFFSGFSDAGGEKVLIFLFFSASGKRKMAGPWIPWVGHSSEDEKTVMGGTASNDSDGSRTSLRSARHIIAGRKTLDAGSLKK